MSEPSGPTGLFRREALQAYDLTVVRGDLLRLPPFWVSWAYGVIVAAGVAGAAFLVLAPASDYAEGPLIVECGRHVEPSPVGAAVERVDVRSGDRVQAGQALIEVGGTVVRASADGVVGGVAASVGERLAAGDPAVSILSDDHREATVLLPGRYRPSLAPGMPLVLEAGDAVLETAITGVGEVLMSADQARRELGFEFAGSVPLGEAPLFAVRAGLSREDLGAARCGTTGTGRVRLRETRLLNVLFDREIAVR